MGFPSPTPYPTPAHKLRSILTRAIAVFTHVCLAYIACAIQRQIEVIDHLKRKQLLLFTFSGKNEACSLFLVQFRMHQPLTYVYFHLLEVVSRYRDPQLQVDENYSYLLNLIQNICKP